MVLNLVYFALVVQYYYKSVFKDEWYTTHIHLINTECILFFFKHSILALLIMI